MNDFQIAVDCHFHVFSANVGIPGARYLPAYTATLDAWARVAHAAGVARGVVVQPSFLGTDNAQMLAALAAQPAALRGVAVVAPNVTAAELVALRAQGVRGVRLNLAGESDDVAAMRAISNEWWSAIGAVDLHLELHANVGRIAALLPHVPQGITLVLDHFAKPETTSARDATVRAVAARPRTFVTLSGHYRQAAGVDSAALAALWLSEIGARALLWGSDWPCTNFEAQAAFAALRAKLNDWVENDAQRECVLAENAQALYWR
jgi:predicted TIM-barrel fold metal-dependent hydrolase